MSFPLFPDTSTEPSAAGARRGVCNCIQTTILLGPPAEGRLGPSDHNDGDNDHNDGGGLQDTKCELLLMSDPYLRLGPFLLEHKNKAGNYIAQVGKVKMYNVRNIFSQKLYKLAHFY